MNILVIGKFYTEGFALHIAETLVAMGHVVQRFEPGFKSGRIGGRIGHRLDQIRGVIHSSSDSVPAIRARRIQSLWQIAEQKTLDVVIVCHDFLWPNEVAELKHRTGATVSMWFPDALVNFGKAFFMNAPYDGLFFKDPFIVHSLAGVVSSPVYYLPECFNPNQHFLPEGEIISTEYHCDITTAGGQHSWRVAFYKHLAGYDVRLWGPPAPLWMPTGIVAGMHQGRLVLNQDKARAFLGAKIVLNNLHYSEIGGLNVRAFEAAGIGAFQMVDWRPGLAQLFEDGKEIISFQNIDDLRKKLNFWLNRPEERLEIATAGKKRAYAEHTYHLRLSLLLDSLAQQANGFPMPNHETV
jgi:spore maturation protein CgeB